MTVDMPSLDSTPPCLRAGACAVSGEESTRPTLSDSALRRGPSEADAAELDVVVRLTLELMSAIARRDYLEAVRASGELQGALLRAQVVADAIPSELERPQALRELQETYAIAAHLLAIVPAPSLAAIEAAERGDNDAPNREGPAWIAGRQSGDSSRQHATRRPYRDTRPDSPKALRDAFRHSGAAASGSVPAIDSFADKEQTP